MTTLQRIKKADAEARELVLQVLNDRGGEPLSPEVIFERAREKRSELSFDSVRRATWALINEGEVSLTDDYRVRT